MKNIFIDINEKHTKMALTIDNEIMEFQIERNNSKKKVSGIYKGKVVNILQGMQATFVDIGLSKNAFLYVGDMFLDTAGVESKKAVELPTNLALKEGDEIMVQVIKDEIGTKGARITTNISIAGRFLVYMPYMNYVGVSRKIVSEERKAELFDIVTNIKGNDTGGFIVRTASETASKKDLINDAKFLRGLFKDVEKQYERAKVKDKIYDDGDIVFRIIRDVYTADINKIVVNDERAFEYIKTLIKKISRESKTKVEYFDKEKNMFTSFGLRQQVENIVDNKVWLSSGGYLIIDKTEALTVIDVNTGKYVGKNNLEETVFKTNMEATKQIAKQLRVRDIGGIVIIDFIDMHDETHREKILTALKEELSKDRIKTTVCGMTNLGLVEVTRKKTQNELLSFLTEPCPYCEGKGYTSSKNYVLGLLTSALTEKIASENKRAYMLYVSPYLVDIIFKDKNISAKCESVWQDKSIYVIADSNLHIKDYNIVSSNDKVLELPDNARLLY